MANETQQTEVTLKLNVQTGDGERGLKSLADSTRKAGQEAKGAQKEFDAFAEAQRRLHRVGQEQQVQAAMRQMTPPPLPGPPPSPWYAQGIGGRMAGMAKMAGPLLGVAYAAGKVVTGAGNAAREIGDLAAQRATTTGGNVSVNEATQLYAKNLAESIPILGGFIKSIGEAARSLSGLSQQAQMATAGLSVIGRQLGVQRGEMAARNQAAAGIYGANIHLADAQAEENATAAYARNLTPARLARYRGAFGGLAEQSDLSMVGVQSAREQIAARERVHAATLGQIGGLRAGAVDAKAVADRLQNRAAAADQARENWLGSGFGHNEFQPTGRQFAREATDANKEAQAAQLLALGKSKDLNEKIALSQRQIADIEATRLKLAEAEAQHARKGQLARAQAVLPGAEGRAMQYGMSSQGRVMQDEQLLDMFKQVGPAGMSPAALQRVMAIPGAADVLGPQIQQLGDERSAGVRERLAGMSPADVGDQMRKPLSDQRDDVRTLLASAAQDEAHQRSGIASEFASAVTDALRGLMDEAIDMIRRENKTDVNNKILFNNGN